MSRSRPSDSFPPPSPPSSPPSSPSAALPPPSPPSSPSAAPPPQNRRVRPQDLSEENRREYDRLELQVFAMAALHAQTRQDHNTLRYSVPPEPGMHGSVGVLVGGDWARARALNAMHARAHFGEVHWRDELEDFQYYHNMEATALTMGLPFSPPPASPTTALAGTDNVDRAALAGIDDVDRAAQPEQGQYTLYRDLRHDIQDGHDSLELQVLAMAALHAQSASAMSTVRRAAPPEHRMFGSMGMLVAGDQHTAHARRSLFYRARLADSQARKVLTNFQRRHRLNPTAHLLGVPPRFDGR